MSDLNWSERLLYRDIRGKVTERHLDYKGKSFRIPLTTYTIEEEDGTLYRGAISGHHTLPSVGNQVEMRLKRLGNAHKAKRFSKNGAERIRWKEILWYIILKDEVPREIQDEPQEEIPDSRTPPEFWDTKIPEERTLH
jgi:hypothetical protein